MEITSESNQRPYDIAAVVPLTFRDSDRKDSGCLELKGQIRDAWRASDSAAASGFLTMLLGPIGLIGSATAEAYFDNRRRHLQALYDARCRGSVAPESAQAKVEQPAATRGNNHFEISLPESLNPTVAAAGAEGGRGASTLTPWEAAVVSEAKVMGQSVKEFAAPALVLGLMALGAVQVIQTGNAATFQRAWAMVR